jgi:hypothetical protein
MRPARAAPRREIIGGVPDLLDIDLSVPHFYALGVPRDDEGYPAGYWPDPTDRGYEIVVAAGAHQDYIDLLTGYRPVEPGEALPAAVRAVLHRDRHLLRARLQGRLEQYSEALGETPEALACTVEQAQLAMDRARWQRDRQAREDAIRPHLRRTARNLWHWAFRVIRKIRKWQRLFSLIGAELRATPNQVLSALSDHNDMRKRERQRALQNLRAEQARAGPDVPLELVGRWDRRPIGPPALILEPRPRDRGPIPQGAAGRPRALRDRAAPLAAVPEQGERMEGRAEGRGRGQ